MEFKGCKLAEDRSSSQNNLLIIVSRFTHASLPQGVGLVHWCISTWLSFYNYGCALHALIFQMKNEVMALAQLDCQFN